MKNSSEIYAELLNKSSADLLKIVYDEEHPYQSTATAILIEKMTRRIYQLEKSGVDIERTRYCKTETKDILL